MKIGRRGFLLLTKNYTTYFLRNSSAGWRTSDSPRCASTIVFNSLSFMICFSKRENTPIIFAVRTVRGLRPSSAAKK